MSKLDDLKLHLKPGQAYRRVDLARWSASVDRHLKQLIEDGTLKKLAGGLYAFHEGFVWPNMLGVVISTQVVLYVLFGGSGTLIGAVIGTVIIEGVSFWLSDNYRDVWPIILGVLLLVVILFRPLGLVSFVLGERERVGSFAAKVPEKRNAAS